MDDRQAGTQWRYLHHTLRDSVALLVGRKAGRKQVTLAASLGPTVAEGTWNPCRRHGEPCLDWKWLVSRIIRVLSSHGLSAALSLSSFFSFTEQTPPIVAESHVLFTFKPVHGILFFPSQPGKKYLCRHLHLDNYDKRKYYTFENQLKK